MNNLLRLIAWFPFWWYGNSPIWFLRFSKNLILYLDRQLAVSLMIRLWLTPLFGDPNIVGHAIALVFRTIRVIYGVVIIALSELTLYGAALLWVAMPFFLLTQYFFYVLLFIAGVFIFFIRKYYDLPEKHINGEKDLNSDPKEFLKPSLANYILNSKNNKDLLSRVLERNVPKKILLKLGFSNFTQFLEAAGNKTDKLNNVPSSILLKEALGYAVKLKSNYIASPHLLLVMLERMGFQYAQCLEVLTWSNREYERSHPPKVWDEKYGSLGLGGFNRSWTGRVTPNLDRYSRDLTREAQMGILPTLIGKKKPLADSLRILERSSKSNVLLVGSPGCGKTTLVCGLAQEIVCGTASVGLQDKRLVMLELGKLSAGTRSAGEIQGRLEDLIDDIVGSRNIILFIDEIHNAVIAGGAIEASVVFSTLEPRIGTYGFQTIGATSWENYRKFIEPNEAFSRLFERVEIPEASFEETLEILEYASSDLESENKVIITLDGLKACIELSQRYVYDRVLPDKAIDLLEEAATYVRNLKKAAPTYVLREDVERLISEKTKIPVTLASGNTAESEVLLNLESKIHERLINQTEAVSAVSNAIRRARTGLRDEKRPITSLLFVGPTGVGKTETAKALAQTFYGAEDQMVRFDMSEFQTETSVESLISKLTDAVRHHPFSLLLLDEAEKANPRILDIFLQVVDDGRLTDASGHTVSFANCLIVFTSNAGTSFIFDNLRAGRSVDEFKGGLVKKLEEEFRIEFLNRFDGIIIYKPLSEQHIEKIAQLKLGGIVKDMAKQGYLISFSDSLVKQVAKEGFDPALGARPMRRLIQDKVESTLAKKILSGELKKEVPLAVDLEILIEEPRI